MGNSCCISPFPGVIPGLVPAGTRQPQLFPSTSKHPNPSYRFLPIPATFSDHQDQSSSRMLWPNCGRGGGAPSQTHLKMGCSPNLSQPGESGSQQMCAGSGMDGLPLADKAVHPKNAIMARLASSGFVASWGRSSLAAHRLWENSFQSSPQSAGKPAFFKKKAYKFGSI